MFPDEVRPEKLCSLTGEKEAFKLMTDPAFTVHCPSISLGTRELTAEKWMKESEHCKPVKRK